MFLGMLCVRIQSLPVPTGITAIVTSWGCATSCFIMPLATSLLVPSPPTAIIFRYPARMASRVSTILCPFRWENAAVYGIPSWVSFWAMLSHVRAVRPLADAGLTTTNHCCWVEVEDMVGFLFFGRVNEWWYGARGIVNGAWKRVIVPD